MVHFADGNVTGRGKVYSDSGIFRKVFKNMKEGDLRQKCRTWNKMDCWLADTISRLFPTPRNTTEKGESANIYHIGLLFALRL